MKKVSKILNKSNKCALILIAIISFFVMLAIPPLQVEALSTSELKNQINSIQSQIDKLNADKKNLQQSTQNAKAAKSQAEQDIQSMKDQIEQSKNDIEILTTEIQKSETEISLTLQSIQDAQAEITKLTADITALQAEQTERINNMYQNATIQESTSIDAILPSNVENFIVKENYQKQLKEQADDFFNQLATKRAQREEEEKQIEASKVEQEKIHFVMIDQQKDLEQRKVELASQIENQKSYVSVLGQTIENNVSKASQIDSQAQDLKSKVSALQSDLFNQLKAIPPNGVKVRRGDFIGMEGDSGYSTGPHLHFFVAKNGSGLQDPCLYLKKGVNSNCNYGDGELSWPMTEVNWSRGFNYPDPGHGAIDIYAFNNLEVYAATDGYLIRDKEPCYSWFPICKDGGANYVIICESQDCRSGFKTGYWHLRK